MIEVFSSGGGTQSTCIAALIVQGKLPKPDFVVIADTDYECGTTWVYLDSVVRPALSEIGVEIHRISGYKSIPEHGKDFLNHNGNTLLMPLWTSQNGDTGKLSGYCSARWKVEVVDRFLSREFGVTRSKYRKWIGFSMDESRRAMRMMGGPEYSKGLIRFPLIHDMPMNRYRAIQTVQEMGWPTPPRSRCYICPNQQNTEWQDLKNNHQDEFEKAVQFEKEVQKHDPDMWLHRDCIPLNQVDFIEKQEVLDYCSSGMCFV